MNSFNPMEAAPRDGTPVVLFFSDYEGAAIGRWLKLSRPCPFTGATHDWFLNGDTSREEKPESQLAGWSPLPDEYTHE